MINAVWNEKKHGVELEISEINDRDDLANFVMEVQSCISVLAIELARHGMEADKFAEFIHKIISDALAKAAEISKEAAYEIEKKNLC